MLGRVSDPSGGPPGPLKVSNIPLFQLSLNRSELLGYTSRSISNLAPLDNAYLYL